MEQCQTSWSRKNSVRQRAERFSQSKNLAETGAKWKMYFTFILKGPHSISLSFERWAIGPHLLLSDSSKTRTLFHRSLSGLPAAHTFFWMIPTVTTPTPKWRWFHRVRCRWSSWTGDKTSMGFGSSGLQKKVDLWLRIVTVLVLRVKGEAQRNGVETKKNSDKFSNCDSYVTCVHVRCFL